MKQFLLAASLLFACQSQGQSNGTWYSFRGNALVFIDLSSKYLITGAIEMYGTPKQYPSRADTFTIKQTVVKNDSTFFVITDKESDKLSKYREKGQLMVQKFRYYRSANCLSTYFFTSLKSAEDAAGNPCLTFFTRDSIESFLKYPRPVDLAKAKVLQLCKQLTKAYEKFNSLDADKKIAYASLGVMFESTIQTPIYLKLKIFPLVNHENEGAISEKFKDDDEVLDALGKLSETRGF